ncbi:MAG TPA: hypothetical protein VKR53_19850 [Puia sp.]|nr:hypothetical protein [Puia sp.]
MQQVFIFFEFIKNDQRISTAHISLYVALCYCASSQENKNPVMIVRKNLMRLSKISGRSTYQKCMQELREYGYIRYEPSFNHCSGQLIYL